MDPDMKWWRSTIGASHSGAKGCARKTFMDAQAQDANVMDLLDITRKTGSSNYDSRFPPVDGRKSETQASGMVISLLKPQSCWQRVLCQALSGRRPVVEHAGAPAGGVSSSSSDPALPAEVSRPATILSTLEKVMALRPVYGRGA